MNRALTTQTGLVEAGFKPPEPNFKWRTKTGVQFLYPSEMETRHLFFTLRMIWNHTMPEKAQIHPFQRYHFGPYYTDAYMQRAIVAIGWELAGRTNLAETWQHDLDAMMHYLFDHKLPYSKEAR